MALIGMHEATVLKPWPAFRRSGSWPIATLTFPSTKHHTTGAEPNIRGTKAGVESCPSVPPYHATTYILHITIWSNIVEQTKYTQYRNKWWCHRTAPPHTKQPQPGLRLYFKGLFRPNPPNLSFTFPPEYRQFRLLFVTYSTRLKIGHEPRPRSPVTGPRSPFPS
jgi:hypothetical protein